MPEILWLWRNEANGFLGVDAAGGHLKFSRMKSRQAKLDRAKLFGFAQVEKVKSQESADHMVDKSSKIGDIEPTDKILWSKIGAVEIPDKVLWSKIGTVEP